MLHNAAGPDFEIGSTPVAATPPEEWHPLVAYDEQVRLEDVSAYAGHLLVHQRSGGLTQLRILELGDDGVGDDYLVDFPQELYTVRGGGGQQFDQPTVQVGYMSMTVPSSVYDYDVRTRELTLLKQQPVRGHDPAAYEEHRLWATADDGAQVPISLVCRKGAARRRPDPLPALRLRRLRDLDRPELLDLPALAAGPRGRVWRSPTCGAAARWAATGTTTASCCTSGNTFSDFAACARHLVETGWTTPDRLVARGRLGGRAADRRRRERLPGALRRPGRRRAVRRRAHLDARRQPAADRHRVRRVGRPRTTRRCTTTSPATRRTTTWRRRTTRRSSPRPRSTTPGCSTSSRPSGWRGSARPPSAGGTSCSRPSSPPATAGSSGRYQAWRDRAFTQAWILDRMGLRRAAIARRAQPATERLARIV